MQRWDIKKLQELNQIAIFNVCIIGMSGIHEPYACHASMIITDKLIEKEKLHCLLTVWQPFAGEGEEKRRALCMLYSRGAGRPGESLKERWENRLIQRMPDC